MRRLDVRDQTGNLLHTVTEEEAQDLIRQRKATLCRPKRGDSFVELCDLVDGDEKKLDVRDPAGHFLFTVPEDEVENLVREHDAVLRTDTDGAEFLELQCARLKSGTHYEFWERLSRYGCWTLKPAEPRFYAPTPRWFA